MKHENYNPLLETVIDIFKSISRSVYNLTDLGI